MDKGTEIFTSAKQLYRHRRRRDLHNPPFFGTPCIALRMTEAEVRWSVISLHSIGANRKCGKRNFVFLEKLGTF